MTTVDTKVRSVLDAPRGRRFSRVGSSRPGSSQPGSSRLAAPRLGPFEPVHPRPESHQARQERLLRQMPDNPRVAHMLEHGPLPHWMLVARQRREQAEREARESMKARAADEAFLADFFHADLSGMAPAKPRGRHRAPRRKRNMSALAINVVLLPGAAVVAAIGQAVAEAVGLLL